MPTIQAAAEKIGVLESKLQGQCPPELSAEGRDQYALGQKITGTLAYAVDQFLHRTGLERAESKLHVEFDDDEP